MRKLISAKLAGNVLIFIMVLLVVFHVLIILKILPSGFVWGGQAKDSPSNLVTLEIISLVLTLIFIFIIAAKIGYIEEGKLKKVIKIGVWIMFIYFILNIFGNLASSVLIEKMIFTPITILLAILTFRLAIEK